MTHLGGGLAPPCFSMGINCMSLAVVACLDIILNGAHFEVLPLPKSPGLAPSLILTITNQVRKYPVVLLLCSYRQNRHLQFLDEILFAALQTETTDFPLI